MELFYALHQRSIAKRIMCYLNKHFWRKDDYSSSRELYNSCRYSLYTNAYNK